MFVPATLLATLLTANGVPSAGFPSWAERSVLVLANRARASPAAALAACKPGDCPDTAASVTARRHPWCTTSSSTGPRASTPPTW